MKDYKIKIINYELLIELLDTPLNRDNYKNIEIINTIINTNFFTSDDREIKDVRSIQDIEPIFTELSTEVSKETSKN